MKLVTLQYAVAQVFGYQLHYHVLTLCWVDVDIEHFVHFKSLKCPL